MSIPLPALGLVFSLFVAFQSLFQFPVGWWRDNHGPRRISLLGIVLAGGGYLGLAYATAIWQIYLLYSLGAVGVGIVYTVAINSALKWFPDSRGLTAGIGTMAVAAGSAVFIPYVRVNVTPAAYSGVLRNMGVLIGAGVICGAVVLRDPPAGWSKETPTKTAASENSATTEKGGYTWREMIQTWQFWTLLGMFAFVNTAGLMLTAKVVSFAQQFGLTAAIVTASATILALIGGVSRIVVGGISDRLNRKWTIAASSILCGCGLFLLVWFGELGSGLGFLIAVVIATFFWSPQFSLFPSIVGDYYGQAHSSTNYALVYVGKVGGGVFGGVLVGVLITITTWSTTFLVGGLLAIVAGIAAMGLRPPERR